MERNSTGQFIKIGKHKICLVCSELFYVSPSQYNRATCSVECAGVFRSNKNSYNWKGGKWKNANGYVMIKINYKHPRARPDGYMFEHIVKIEKKIGRMLKKGEIIHHKNGKKDDNRLNNLLLCTAREHRRIHEGWKKKGKKLYKHCWRCKKMLEVNKKNFWFSKVGDSNSICKPCSKEYRKEWVNKKLNNNV